MKKILVKKLSGIIFLLFIVCLTPVYGAVSLSVSPMDGGSSLRFSRSDVQSRLGHEVRVRITSNDSTQYQVFQRWAQPLSPTGAGSGFERDFLKFYGLSGSNGAGTLYGNIPDFISLSDQLVYTSSGNGTSDGFILVYQVDPDRLQVSGEYIGRLLLTVRPIGSAQSSEVYVDVFVDADIAFRFEVRGSRGYDTIHLVKGVEPGRIQDEVSFAFEGNTGEIRVYQEVLDPIALVSDKTELAKGSVLFRGVGVTDGLSVEMPATLDFGRQLIYRSWNSQDQWDMEYSLKLDQTFPIYAGEYRSRLRYIVERPGLPATEYDFGLEMEIEPRLEIHMTFETGGVVFDKLYPGSPPQDRKVVVRVDSNIKRPYAVIQRVSGPMQNEKQQLMEKGYFNVKTVLDPGIPGRVRLPDFEDVSEQDTYLYFSDADGSPAQFEVIYRVMPYRDMTPGDYRAEITYTLEEI